MQFLFILAVLVPAVWYYAALGKRISAEEKKAGRDLTNEKITFNPLQAIQGAY